MTPLVIVPARAGSKGVPNKNFALLPDGSTLVGRAVEIGQQIGEVVVTSDKFLHEPDVPVLPRGHRWWLNRPAELAADDTPMRDVVEHVLAQIPGDPDQPIVLLQPTTPLRRVDVVEIVMDTHRARNSDCGVLTAYRVRALEPDNVIDDAYDLPPRRQVSDWSFVATGEAYVFSRRTGFPSCWFIHETKPTLNIDEIEDWEALCQIIRAGQSRQTDSPAP